MATSTKQAVATVPVYDYLLNPGDAALTNPAGLGGKRVKVTLAYDKARSNSPVTWLANDTVYSTLTDSNGFWQVNVVPTDSITPSGTYYIVEVEGYLSYKINPTLAGVPGVGWQSSAITIDLPATLVFSGQSVSGPFTVGGLLTAQAGIAVNPGEPGLDVSSAGALVIGDNTATSIELGVATSVPSLNNVQYAPPPTGADMSAVLQALVNLLNAANNNAIPNLGGFLILQPGIYFAENLIIPTGVTIIGAGPEATLIKLNNSAGVTHAVLSTKNFDALTGTNPASGDQGPYAWGIQALTIDGNKANNGSNTAVATLRTYGYGFRVNGVRVRNSNTAGWKSEWSSAAGAPALGDSMEAHVNDVKTHDNVGDGVIWTGPHDSDCAQWESYNNGGKGFNVIGNGNGTKFSQCHGWGLSQTYPWYIDTGATGVNCLDCTGEGGSVAQCFIGANDFEFVGGQVFAGGGATTGFVIGDGGHTGISGTMLVTKALNCTTAAVSFAQDAGGTYIVDTFGTSGNAYTGAPNASSLYEFPNRGGIANAGNSLGTAKVIVRGLDLHYTATASGGGGAPTLPANTPAGAAGGAGQWMLVQLNGVNAYLLVWQ